jgi:maleate cis-trans isomerase
MTKRLETTQLEYAPKGLIGVLTPQANTTVEPEFAILCPPGVGYLNARMVSAKRGMEERLADYGENIDTNIDQFGNAPITALALAVTGASYLIGRDAEDALVERIRSERGLPLVTAARAVCDALALLDAKQVALISPYPESLTAKSAAYWASRGFSIGDIVQLQTDADSFHPIYSMPSDAAAKALAGLKNTGADAIVLLGTGMPTLAPIAQCAGSGDWSADWSGPPVISSLFCVAWRSAAAAAGRQPDRADLEHWLSAAHWGGRLDG